MSVGQMCVHEVDTAQPNESAQAAAERMHARNVGTLVVVNEREEPVGMLTDRDLAVRIVAAGRNPLRTTVAQVMTHHPTTLDEDSSVESAMAVMCAGPCRRLPIVDADQKLVGLLCFDDVLAQLASQFAQMGELVRRESPANLAHG